VGNNHTYAVAFRQGCIARENGWERNSPYSKLIAEAYWLAGYDGHSFDEARRAHEDAKEIKRKHSYSRIGLNNV
jgi:hypothetical protein